MDRGTNLYLDRGIYFAVVCENGFEDTGIWDGGVISMRLDRGLSRFF